MLSNPNSARGLAYNPFCEMEEMERRFFGEPFGRFFGWEPTAFKTDITDQGENYLLEADLPGFQKGDISIDITGDTLTLRAERHAEHEDDDKQGDYLRRERSFGQYTRAFDIAGIDQEGIRAKLENGVLKLTLPKKETVAPAGRHLEIE